MTLQKLYSYETLDRAQACDLLLEITSGSCSEAQVSAFLSVFLMRKLTVAELMGFQDAMLSCCNKLDLAGGNILDIVGTGGDGKNTFNISTAAAIVTAATGVKVAKHGNSASTSICGSSDVLQYLGYRFTANPDLLNRQLDETNLCFLHAPLFHPVMRHVAVARKNLGMRTLFNMLGPIVNPAMPCAQFLGVSNLSLMRSYQYLLQERQVKQYRIINTLDGYDEISLTGPFKMISSNGEQIIHPAALGMKVIRPNELDGGHTVADASKILLNILKGEGSPAQNEVVIANSGFAIQCARPELETDDCLDLARAALQSGKAYQSFSRLINTQS